MHRGHCVVGTRLYDLYQQHSLDLVIADAEKRLAMVIAGRSQWLALSRGVERLKAEYEDARRGYIEHVVACKVCEWDQLSHICLAAIEHRSLAEKDESVSAH